jgi:N-acetylneuraminate lyase/4-hydroxy-tetrahydrodipicolinate synthase
MAGKKLTGIFPPIITAFTEQGDFYEKGQTEIIEFLLARGVHGLFAIGSYGSFALMNIEERKRLTRMILKIVADRVPIVFQVGAPSTRFAVELAKDAEANGAAAVAAVIPFYYSGIAYRELEILQHYSDLVKAVNVPVWLYNNPRTTGFHPTTDLVVNLAEAGVTGMKDSSGDYMTFVDWLNEVKAVSPDFTFMAGTVGMLQPTYYLGAQGCVAGTANAFPELVINLYNALKKGDVKLASKLQAKVIAVRKCQQVSGFRPAGCYPLLRWRGVDPGTVRKPWREPREQELKIMRAGMEKIGVL